MLHAQTQICKNGIFLSEKNSQGGMYSDTAGHGVILVCGVDGSDSGLSRWFHWYAIMLTSMFTYHIEANKHTKDMARSYYQTYIYGLIGEKNMSVKQNSKQLYVKINATSLY